MPHEIFIKVAPDKVKDKEYITLRAANQLQLDINNIKDFRIVRKSLDARKKPAIYQLKLLVFEQDEECAPIAKQFQLKPPNKKTCHIIGFGPAGIFAALQCLELGIKPIVIERGKSVDKRIGDIAAIHKKGQINGDSNYCFGEGGAGTYSDGKLYTRSSKRGDVQKVLDTFVQFGAAENISYEAHPHIGTNKLPKIIAAMRQKIIEMGGEILFEQRVIDFVVEKNHIKALITSDEKEHACENVILATGHSARDIFNLLHNKNIRIEAKPFALGVRIEHHQSLIDSIQYKQPERGDYLPPASYNLVTQANDRGVFSFCMCPGGVIAPAGTEPGSTVVNGWSSSARNGKYSNSGLVVEVRPENWLPYAEKGPLAALEFQKQIEIAAFQATGSLQAPAQRVEDFIQHKMSTDLPRTSYTLGLVSHDLQTILPKFIARALRKGLIDFGKKMRGYRTNDAVLVGVESRSSSPVRIPRNKETLRHPEISNLFPCGEGAGYAGGIVSAAMDGMRCAKSIV